MTTPITNLPPGGRANPADASYPWRKWLGQQNATFHAVQRTQADSHQQGDPGTPGTPPPAVTYTVQIDPANPHLVMITSDAFTGNEHYVDLPISTLFVSDPTNSHLLILPTLST